MRTILSFLLIAVIVYLTAIGYIAKQHYQHEQVINAENNKTDCKDEKGQPTL